MLEKLSNLPLPRVQYGKIDGIHSTAEREHTSALRAPHNPVKLQRYRASLSNCLPWRGRFMFFIVW